MVCKQSSGSFRSFYTGNQLGYLNQVGPLNFVAGGLPGSGISSGTIYEKFFQAAFNRALWESLDAELNQKLLDACYPFIELRWIAEIELTPDVTFKISNRNIYVQDDNGLPRFYEARAKTSPMINITSGEWLNPNYEIGDLKLTLNNRDGFFNEYLPHGENYTQWMGASVKVFVGFGEKRSNYFEVFTGHIATKKGVETTLEDIMITAYDSQDKDEIEIPTLIYDRTNFPFVDADKIGSPLPIIYGDYSTDTNDYGDISAICSNALDSPIISYVWNISENALRDIGNVYLHRGNRSEGQDTPIRFKDSVIIKEPLNGRVLVPFGISVLEEVYALITNGKPGATGVIGQVIAESSDQNFITLGVQVGDSIKIDGDTMSYDVTEVNSGSLSTTFGSVITKDNGYTILTDKYAFRDGDKISLFCKGKDLEVMSVTRIADTLVSEIGPTTLSIGLVKDYWVVDNNAKKIYNFSFDDKIIEEINFSSISSEISQVTGIDIQVDNTLWLFDRPLSKVYRYVVDEKALGSSFTTTQVSGLESELLKGGPLSINEGNILTIHDQNTGEFYRINPFAGANPGLIGSYNRSAFESEALDIVDIASDINSKQTVIMDRSTNKVYRVDETNGVKASELDLVDKVASNFTEPRGVSYYIDGTIFLMNGQDLSIYNYNEFEGANDNPGFIVRDILQKYVGKSTFDFNLKWNETCRGSLADLKARVSIDSKTTTLSYINKMMLAYNCSVYQEFSKYSLFQIAFDNFSTDGLPLRQGDIKLKSFNPKKEYNQYFNVGVGMYKRRPFTNSRISSDNYVSPTGVQFAGREIQKSLNLDPIYRREDVDKILPLFVRLAASEPEFVDLSSGFRFMFAQLNTFYNINFAQSLLPNVKSGRRFDNIPSFVRKIQMNLDSMEIKLKLWSLGTTQFGDFLPVGPVVGGENEKIILTNLGTFGTVAPIGTIISSNTNSITLEDVNLVNAENRASGLSGKAWDVGDKLGIYSGAGHDLIEELTVSSVSGQVLTFSSDMQTTVENSVKNSAGFMVDGHYIRYLSYSKAKQRQTITSCYYGNPIVGYPLTGTSEVEDQRAGSHNFVDGRLPYVLHPIGFQPA